MEIRKHFRSVVSNASHLACFGALVLTAPVKAQGAVMRVTARSGVAFSVPTTFQDVAPPNQPAGGTVDRALVAGQSSEFPIDLTVLSMAADPPRILGELPHVSGPLPARYATDFAAGMMNTLRVSLNAPGAPYDVKPLEFDSQRSAFALSVTLRLPSQARALLLEDDSSPNWEEVRKAGADSILVRCLLEQLLAGAPVRTGPELEGSYSAAASRCGVPVNVVQSYVKETGLALFGPQTYLIYVTAFVTSTGMTMARIMGGEPRMKDIDDAAALIWTSAVVPPAVAPNVTVLDQAFNFASIRPAALAGQAVGTLVGTFGIGALLAWLLVRFRMSSRLATGVSLFVLFVIAILGARDQGGLPPREIPMLTLRLVVSVLAYFPLVKWLTTKVTQRKTESA